MVKSRYYDLDPAICPDPIKKVVVLRGSWYEMGRQYGERAREAVHARVREDLASVIKMNGSMEQAKANNLKSRQFIEENAPELMDFWKGMAETAGVELETVLTASLWSPPPLPEDSEEGAKAPQMRCSTVSAWGKTTEGGKTLAGVNNDGEIYSTEYEPVVIAYPENGNPYISYSGLFSNCMFNTKGLALMLSAGPCAKPGDLGPGLPPLAAVFLATHRCEDSNDTLGFYLQEGMVPGGENFHMVTRDGQACVVERTAQAYAIRKPGDFDEGSYMIATNCFRTNEMAKSNDEEDLYGSFPRFSTEQQLFKENEGSCTVDTINDILGCTDWYVNGQWTRDDWSQDGFKGLWSPENKSPESKALMRCIVDLDESMVFVMNGCRIRALSSIPGSTGNFYRLKLADNIEDTVARAVRDAKVQIFLGARDVIQGGEPADKMQWLDKARAKLFEGFNYTSMSVAEDDINTKDEMIGCALTAFAKAQCYAQLAQNETQKILRDYEDYELQY